MNANIEKTNDTQLVKAPLTKKERSALSNKITGWGKLANAVLKTGLNEGTLKRAAAGMDVKPETAKKIIDFLSL